MLKKQNILFLGCGKMGRILLENLLEEKSAQASQIKVIEKSDQNKIGGIFYAKTVADLPKNYGADLVFLCIKPQESKEVLKKFSQAKIFHKNTIFISILAGKKLAFLEGTFGKDVKAVRSMPNLPIQDSQGVFAYLLNKNISKSDSENLKKIFEKFGAAFELKEEKLFDAFTAIFGSGPAYIFLLEEIFTEITVSCGIKKDAASSLVKTLFLGSSLMSCNSTLNFSELRESVTSKGGTTEAALKILQKNFALKNLFKKSINAAIKKSQEISAS